MMSLSASFLTLFNAFCCDLGRILADFFCQWYNYNLLSSGFD
jgi:hypothetical protein